VRERRRLSYISAAVLGLALRLLFILRWSLITGDSLVYSDLARNLLHHHTLALTENGVAMPAIIRLPGYPAFLAAIFAVFGDNNFFAVVLVQTGIDLLTCVAVARLAGELVSNARRESAMRWAFVLAALCPFTANYVALPLTETLAIAATAWALLFAVRVLRTEHVRDAILSGLACAAGILLRPDNGIVMAVICAVFFVKSLRVKNPRLLQHTVLIGLIAVLPLVPWTYRNWKVFHLVQPLAPRYANQPEEFVPRGFNRWTKTWIIDYVSVEEVYWNIESGDYPDLAAHLPDRGFDSADQRQRTLALFERVQDEGNVTGKTDADFAELARERIAAHPLRYYLLLPAARTADMWFRPRVEMLPIEKRWWEFEDDDESMFSIDYALLNAAYIVLAVSATFVARNRLFGPGVRLLISFVIVRSLFLGTLENPEPRYTLECFPVVVALAAICLSSSHRPSASYLNLSDS
jgi:hypothetical protein